MLDTDVKKYFFYFFFELVKRDRHYIVDMPCGEESKM